MATNAGSMFNGAQPNPHWVLASGQPLYCLDAKQPQRTKGVLSEGNRQDYIRQVGWQGRRRGLGPLGWIIPTGAPIHMPSDLVNAANDAAAGVAGVPVGVMYRNGSALMTRVV